MNYKSLSELLEEERALCAGLTDQGEHRGRHV